MPLCPPAKQAADILFAVREIGLIMANRVRKLTVVFCVLLVIWLFMSRGSSDNVITYANNPVGETRRETGRDSQGDLLGEFQEESQTFPFNNPELTWDARVDDLVGRLTLDEITAQMANGGRTTHAPGIPRLGIKPYPWGSECLRGDVDAGPATSFPQAIGLSATFSRDVIFNVSMATGLEVRAKYNNYSSHGNYGIHTSASCWSPVINIARDPRWGRNQETYGEDPFMSGELSVAYVNGLQGDHERYIMANAGCKHYDAYGGPENIPISRHMFDAKVTEADLRNTFLPAFKKCVQAGTYSIMCSYNRVNGVPACANKKLLKDILRGEWGFNGYVISDEGAIEDILDNHKYVDTVEDAATVAVLAGTNLEDGPARRNPYFSAISSAVHRGKLNESVVREAVKPLFYTRMRLGLFDPPEMNPFSQLNISEYVQNEKHRELAITSAMRSLVLLKNNDLLPLKIPGTGKLFKKVAIVGPMADNVGGIFGGYAPDPDPRYVYTPLRGLSGLGDAHSYDPGCAGSDTKCPTYDAQKVQKAVSGADFVIVCLGTGANIESESHDRENIELPGKQLQLLQDAVNYASGAPVILLVFSGGPLDIAWAVTSPAVKAIIECFFPAQGTGQALYQVFFNQGEGSNPAGRLPMTWPTSVEQYPAITDYSMVGRTYRYFTKDPLFPFGYGMSYTTFEYKSVTVSPSVLHFTDILMVDVYVDNTGHYGGEEVVQLYVSWPDKSLPSTPNIQLIGFGRYFIKPGQAITCSFKISLEELALWHDTRERFVVTPGVYTLYAGGQQPNQKVKVQSNVVMAEFRVDL